MKMKILVVTVMLTLTACQSTDEGAMEDVKNIAGGWQTSAVNKEISQAAEVAKQYLNKEDVAISSISEIKQQVVAGMNYSFLMKLADNSEYLMTVFHDLNNKFHVTESTKVK